MSVVHALSIDLEDWNNAAVLWMSGRVVPPTDDVVRNGERMLELLEETGVRATWFVLGEVAETFPELVRSLVRAGHEVGVHGFHHHRLHELGEDRFRESIVRAKGVVEDAAGVRVKGYRAVAMSLTRETWWAYDAVVEAGFAYSSSLFPTRASRHGVPDAPVEAHVVRVEGGQLLEIPLTVVSLAGVRLPAVGGGYLRHLPLWFSRWALRKLGREGRPAVVYLHPYELDAHAKLKGLPDDLDGDARRRIERLVPGQFRNREHTERKLRNLLGGFSFAPIETVFADLLPRPVQVGA
jgi:polysaccharide deacetylase family protein (PEP-CTERM system associated)